MNRKEAASLLVSGLAISGGVLAAYFTAGATTAAPIILGEGIKAFGGLGGNLVANCLQTNLIDKHPQEDVLKNGDLTRAIGNAIFKICGELAAETYDPKDKASLLTLSETDLEIWENLIIGGEYQEGYGLVLTDINLDEVTAEKSVQYVHAQAGKLDEIKTLTSQSWQNIIGMLCNKIETFNRKAKCSLSNSVKAELADKLHNQFARALRKVLIADFAKDGKAYASMQFRIFGEILNYLNELLISSKQNYEQNEAILALVISSSRKVEDLTVEVARINQNSPTHYSPKNKKQWQEIFTDFNSFRETLDKTFQNTETIVEIVTKILENQTKQSKYSKPKPKGLINLPREKNDYFVEQSNVFARIDEKLAAHHLAYLHGTHGLGKTTTLNEYARARVENYDFIFYVLATDGAIETEMARLADEFLETIAAEDTPAQKASKLKVYLEESGRWTKADKNWLIIFDNLESRERISQYFPRTAKGDCLYACNERLFLGNDREVSFEQFSPAEAELFVYQKLNRNSEKQHADIAAENLAEIKKLIERLGRLPLALNIAAVYLSETGISIDDYLGLLRANVGKFLKYTDAHREHQNDTAFEAFLITLDKISNFKDADCETVGKLAETFLNLLIFCAPEDIPEELVKDTLFQSVDASGTSTPPDILFRETVALLKRYGLVKEKKKPFKYKEKYAEPKTLADGTTAHWEEKETVINVFDTYRTLQDVLSIKLEDEAKKNLLEKLLIVFNSLLPKPDVTTWEIFEKYAVHAFPVVKYAEKLTISNGESFRVCNEIGLYFDDIAKYSEAEYFYLLGKTISEDFYGKDQEKTATIYNNLASLYRTQSRYKEAEPLYKQALTIYKRALGENHPDTATSHSNLASLYTSQSKYEEAEPLYKQALEIHERVSGENHPLTATIYNNLAELYRIQSRHKEAEPLYKQALFIREMMLGKNHPDTATVYNNLALLYASQSKYKEAESLHKQVIEIFEKELGENHPSTATVYNNLAILYNLQGKYKEAESLYKQALSVREKVLGENHLSTAGSYLSLGALYCERGQSETGLKLCEKALRICQNTLPVGHPDIKICESWVEGIKNSMNK